MNQAQKRLNLATTKLEKELKDAEALVKTVKKELTELRGYCSHPLEFVTPHQKQCAEDDDKGTCQICGATL